MGHEILMNPAAFKRRFERAGREGGGRPPCGRASSIGAEAAARPSAGEPCWPEWRRRRPAVGSWRACYTRNNVGSEQINDTHYCLHAAGVLVRFVGVLGTGKDPAGFDCELMIGRVPVRCRA